LKGLSDIWSGWGDDWTQVQIGIAEAALALLIFKSRMNAIAFTASMVGLALAAMWSISNAGIEAQGKKYKGFKETFIGITIDMVAGFLGAMALIYDSFATLTNLLKEAAINFGKAFWEWITSGFSAEAFEGVVSKTMDNVKKDFLEGSKTLQIGNLANQVKESLELTESIDDPVSDLQSQFNKNQDLFSSNNGNPITLNVENRFDIGTTTTKEEVLSMVQEAMDKGQIDTVNRLLEEARRQGIIQ